MSRLSALDSSFLRVETPTAHMHVGWLATLALPEGSESLDAALLGERIGGRLQLTPRFRQRLATAPVGEPAWVDDPGFRLDRHLVLHEGHPPSRAGLDRIAGTFLSRQLNRSLPLWEILVVPRLDEPGRAALVGKVHHAMVDGIAAVELGTLLFDLAPDPALPEPDDWHPERVPGPLLLAAGSVVDGALEQFRVARRVAALGLAPRRSLRVAETMRRTALRVAEDVIRPAPPSYLNPEIGPRRSLVTVRVPFARLAAVKERHGVKLNDVVLTVATGALRRFAGAHDEEPEPLRAMVPVSVRREGEGGGNRITFAFLDLPLDEPRALRRLSVVHDRTQELKSSGRVAGSDALLRGVGQLPGFLKERAARIAASPRMYNLTVSNVPGPRVNLYAAGAEVEAIYPVIPIANGHALAIGVLSYRDQVHFACFADPEALPASTELPGLIEASLAELERSAKPNRARRTSHEKVSAQPSQRGSSKPAYS